MTASFDVTRREFLGISLATSTTLVRPGVARLLSAPPVCLAVLGAGARGRSCLATLQGMPWATVSLLIDPLNSSRRVALDECFARGMSPVGSGSDADALTNDDVTALVLAAPSRENARLALAAVEAGKHIYLEPPAAMDAAALDRVAQAAAAAGRVAQHGTPLLSSARRRMIEAGAGVNGVRVCCTMRSRGTLDVSAVVPPTLQHEIDFAVRLLRASRVEEATAVVSPVHSPGGSPRKLAVVYLTLAGMGDDVAPSYLVIELLWTTESSTGPVFESSLEAFSREQKWALTGTAPLPTPGERFDMADRRLHLGNFVQAVRRQHAEGLRAPIGAEVLTGYAVYEAATTALADAQSFRLPRG